VGNEGEYSANYDKRVSFNDQQLEIYNEFEEVDTQHDEYQEGNLENTEQYNGEYDYQDHEYASGKEIELYHESLEEQDLQTQNLHVSKGIQWLLMTKFRFKQLLEI
jgi:hypothetical protein